MDHGKSIALGAVMLVLGLAGGYGIASAGDDGNSMHKDGDSHMVSTSGKASDLRATLVSLGVEHMILTDQAVADALDGSPAAKETGAALYANGTTIGAAVGSVYGKEAETTFNQVWKLHLDEFVNYAVALKGGDQAAADSALAKIDSDYTKPLAAYLAKANPNLPQQTLETSLRDHVDMTASIIRKHVSGDYAGEATELKKANEHITMLMSTLAGGIVKQFPDKFQG